MRKLMLVADGRCAGPGGCGCSPASARSDKDCSDFPTQKAAQRWFKHHSPRSDPSGLDADHDGIAC
jgi:micrococcal nuclease